MAFALALCQPNREIAVSRTLDRWRFPNHVFKIRSRCMHRGRVVDRLRPAFPRYIFLDPLGAWHALRTRFGIFDFVRDGERVATVPDVALNSLLRVADPQGVLPTPEIQSSRFRVGDLVRYEGEAIKWLANQRARFQYLLDENRAMVEIDWFGRFIPIPVDERDLVLDFGEQKPIASRRKRRRRRRRAHGNGPLVTAGRS